ncbi:MAG TPA: hypothetical protein VGQ78_07295 [Vicinamibacteria bacterium]|jgi:hypothetical protein|nr:hypothetical protein [Vicinamibacteria bacterium]
MDLEKTRETELRELVERLDRLIPKDGAHLSIPADADGNSTVGSRLGYLRFGVEFLAAALEPRPGSDEEPTRIVPDLDYLLTDGSETPFDLCEVDEAIGSRPPVRTRLGPIGQLAAAILVIGALILIFIGGAVVLRRLLG